VSTTPPLGHPSSRSGGRRRSRLSWVLFVLLLVMPIVEIYLLVQVGQVIGAWPTILMVIAMAALGAWLVKREGRRAWQALQTALSSGRMPGRELADGALVLIGGTLMIAPGFVTDVFGFLLVLPLTRPLFRRLLAALVSRKVTTLGGPGGGPGGGHGGGFPAGFGFPGSPGPGPRRPEDDRVVPGEVVDP